MAKRAAQGTGNIRKKTVTRRGKAYTYWEARITTGRDPGTGKQIQRSFTGRTQKEVREKLQAAAVAINTGTFTPVEKMTVGQWLDIWAAEYLGNLKPLTVIAYRGNIKNHIKPALGAMQLSELRPHAVQGFINGLSALSVNTVKLAYRVLHAALEKAVQLDYIPRNPAAKCILPKDQQKAIRPLDDDQTAALLAAAQGSSIEFIVSIALFTGLRMSEIVGLTWDSLDITSGILTVNKQLSLQNCRSAGIFSTPKSGKGRTLTVAPSVVAVFKAQYSRQLSMQIRAGAAWHNEHGLIFTTEDGSPFYQGRVTRAFQAILNRAGLQGVRFHDLRHTYAVNSLRAGDDVKTLQGNLGHASAAFTLDKYGHFTERMKQDSADRMENFIKSVLNL